MYNIVAPYRHHGIRLAFPLPNRLPPPVNRRRNRRLRQVSPLLCHQCSLHHGHRCSPLCSHSLCQVCSLRVSRRVSLRAPLLNRLLYHLCSHQACHRCSLLASRRVSPRAPPLNRQVRHLCNRHCSHRPSLLNPPRSPHLSRLTPRVHRLMTGSLPSLSTMPVTLKAPVMVTQ